MRPKTGGIISIIMVILLVTCFSMVYGFEQVRLKEIINQEDTKEAIIIIPEGREIMVKEGETTPDGSCQVVEINERSLTIKQLSSDGKRIILRKIRLDLAPQSIRIPQND